MNSKHKKKTPGGLIESSVYECYEGRSGFTLIEMLIVISIIGIVMSAAGRSNSIAFERSRDAQVMIELNRLRTAVHQFVLRSSGEYPESLLVLCPEFLNRIPEVWHGSRASGRFNYDAEKGEVLLFDDGGNNPQTINDSQGRSYCEY